MLPLCAYRLLELIIWFGAVNIFGSVGFDFLLIGLEHSVFEKVIFLLRKFGI